MAAASALSPPKNEKTTGQSPMTDTRREFSFHQQGLTVTVSDDGFSNRDGIDPMNPIAGRTSRMPTVANLAALQLGLTSRAKVISIGWPLRPAFHVSKALLNETASR
jgi:hypothetical protein